MTDGTQWPQDTAGLRWAETCERLDKRGIVSGAKPPGTRAKLPLGVSAECMHSNRVTHEDERRDKIFIILRCIVPVKLSPRVESSQRWRLISTLMWRWEFRHLGAVVVKEKSKAETDTNDERSRKGEDGGAITHTTETTRELKHQLGPYEMYLARYELRKSA